MLPFEVWMVIVFLAAFALQIGGSAGLLNGDGTSDFLLSSVSHALSIVLFIFFGIMLSAKAIVMQDNMHFKTPQKEPYDHSLIPKNNSSKKDTLWHFKKGKLKKFNSSEDEEK